ncbi:MAG: hypothetical protein WCG75_11740, partial [Armatimonadota bacterium]
LGYYRRCRMLLDAAKLIAQNGFPQSRDAWLKIPGVGRYTAAAIASICLGEPSAVVDGNVERVVARLTCDPATGSKLKDNSWMWADKHMFSEEPGEWNQAVMELGATVCKPTQPQCSNCPVKVDCVAFQTNRVSEFPSPKIKAMVLKSTEELLIPLFGDEVGILESHENSWWKGLSLLPLTSTFAHLIVDRRSEHLGEIHYTVTNHKIRAMVSFMRFDVKPEGLTWVAMDKMHEVPLPAPHRKAIGLLYKT